MLSSALCQVAESLVGSLQVDQNLLVRAAAVAAADDAKAPAIAMLAMGLFNALNNAIERSRVADRDVLLGELRKLARKFPDEAEVRRAFAMGLVNSTKRCAEEEQLERQKSILHELHALVREFPRDAAVRGQLAMCLFNALSDAKKHNQLDRRDAVLKELWGSRVNIRMTPRCAGGWHRGCLTRC